MKLFAGNLVISNVVVSESQVIQLLITEFFIFQQYFNNDNTNLFQL